MEDKVHISSKTLLAAFETFKRHVYETYIIDEDEVVRKPDGKGVHWLNPFIASGFARVFSILYKLNGDPKDKEFAKACIEHVKRSAIYAHGTYIWELPTPSICSHGRYWTNMLFVAECLKDEGISYWLETAIAGWPFSEEKGLFYVHFSPVTGKETAHNHPYNMELEAAVPAWIVGKRVGNEVLMDRGKRVIEKFFLPNQRPDSFWDYDYEGVYGTERLEYLYSAYCVLLASRLLVYPEWRSVLAEPLKYSIDTTLKHCLREDGSIYTPTHWGWGHIWESTALVCNAMWYLQRYLGIDYGEIIAKGIDWVLRCKLQEISFDPPPQECGEVTRHIAELAYNDVNVEGKRAEIPQILQTLETVDKELFNGSNAPQRHFKTKTALSKLMEKLKRNMK